MYHPLPSIHEPATQLQQQMRHEPHTQRRQRLHALYLVASGQAQTRQDVARILGVDRNTVGRWLQQYATDGLAGLLQVYVPAGRVAALTSAQEAQLRSRLQQPDGFASYAAIQQWITTTFSVSMTYNAVHKLVHTKLHARPKVVRPSHEKKTLQP